MSEESVVEQVRNEAAAPINVTFHGHLLAMAVEDASALINNITKVVHRNAQEQNGAANGVFDNATSLLPILAAIVDGFPIPDDFKEAVIASKRTKIEEIISKTKVPTATNDPEV